MSRAAFDRLMRVLKWENPGTTPKEMIVLGNSKFNQTCQWPDCDVDCSMFMGVGTKPKVAVCPEHSRQFRKLGVVEYNKMPWQGKRYWDR